MNFDHTLSVTIDRQKLVDTLIKNRKCHNEHFVKALAGWKKESVELLENLCTEIASGKVPSRVHILSSPPMDMSREYDTAIEMFSWHTANETKLTQQQFRALIQDDWEWKKDWSMSNSKYLGDV